MAPNLFTEAELKALSMLFTPVPAVASRSEMRGKVVVALTEGKTTAPEKGLLWHMVEFQLVDLLRVVH